MFLLDTMVLSEAGKRQPNPSVLLWRKAQRVTDLHVSVVTFAEIYDGIERKRSRNPEFGRRLDDWAEAIRELYRERTLPISTSIALRWGRLSAALGRRDFDLFIAATALEHDLVVVTRNIRHFEATGVKLFNPYEG